MELKDYLAVIRRRKWLIILSVILVSTVAFTTSYRKKPLYRSTATMVVPTRNEISLLIGSRDDLAAERAVQILILKMQSYNFAKEVADNLRFKTLPEKLASRISLEVDPKAPFTFNITATHANPERAALIANAYANNAITSKSVSAQAEIAGIIERIERKLTKYEQQIARLSTEMAERSLSTTSAKNTVTVNGLTNSYNRLLETRDELALIRMYNEQTSKLIQPATEPTEPFNKKPKQDGLAGMVVGLILGISAASVLEYFDKTFRSIDEIKQDYKVPLLGKVKISPSEAKNGKYEIVSSKPSSHYAEAYRTLQTNVDYLARKNGAKTLLFTSTFSRGNESIVLANLAAVYAESGMNVGIICCNVRNPKLHHFFEIDNKYGLTNLLNGDGDISKATYDGKIKGVQIIPSGPIPRNPAEVLNSPTLDTVLAKLKKENDVVLVDAAPIVAVNDAEILTPKVDGIILMVATGKTSRESANGVRSNLDSMRSKILGVVVLEQRQQENFLSINFAKTG